MSKKSQAKLSPIERNVRNMLVVKLDYMGLSGRSICNIMNMNQSTVSRAIDRGTEGRTMDDVLSAAVFG